MSAALIKNFAYLGCLSLALDSGALNAGEIRVVRYSKSELASMPRQAEFLRATDLGDILSVNIKKALVTMTQRQTGSNTATRSVVESWRPLSSSARMKKLSTLSVTPEQLERLPNENLLRDALANQSRKAIEQNVRGQFPIFEMMRSGMKFNLDLSNLSSTGKQKTESPVIRYGLVETEIIFASRPPSIAALGSISDLDREYASSAKVIYTIDKLSDSPDLRSLQESSTDEQIIQNTDIWSKMPARKLNFKIGASDQDSAMSDQVSNGALPGAKVSITQADGLFSTQFTVGGKSNLKKSLVHQVQAPLFGEMSFARQYDHKLKATQTSALNVLGSSSRPRLNFTYLHKEARAKGELVMRRNSAELSVIAEPRAGWKPNGQEKLGQPGDKISVAFSSAL